VIFTDFYRFSLLLKYSFQTLQYFLKDFSDKNSVKKHSNNSWKILGQILGHLFITQIRFYLAIKVKELDLL